MMALSSWNTGKSIPGVMPHPPGCPMADVRSGLLKKCICVLECLSYVEVLSPAFWVWLYLEIRFCRCKNVRLRSQWIREGPKCSDQCPYERRETWQHKHRGMKPRDDGSREWSDVAASHGHWGLAVTTRSQEFQEGPSPSACREEPGPGNVWTPSSSVLREYVCVILGHPVCDNLLSAVPED